MPNSCWTTMTSKPFSTPAQSLRDEDEPATSSATTPLDAQASPCRSTHATTSTTDVGQAARSASASEAVNVAIPHLLGGYVPTSASFSEPTPMISPQRDEYPASQRSYGVFTR